MTADLYWHPIGGGKPVACCEECFNGTAFCRCEEDASEREQGGDK